MHEYSYEAELQAEHHRLEAVSMAAGRRVSLICLTATCWMQIAILFL